MSAGRGKLTRLAWLALFIFLAGTFVLSLPTTFRQHMTLAATARPAGWTAGDMQAALAAAHMPANAYALLFSVSLWLATGLYLGSGAFMVLKRPDDEAVLAISALLMVFGWTFFQVPAMLFEIDPASRIVTLLGQLNLGFLFTVPCVFPDGRFVPRWSRWFMLCYLVFVTLCYLVPPLNVGNWPMPVLVAFTLLIVVVPLGSQVYRYARVSNAIQRQQTKWAAFGMVSALGLTLVIATVMDVAWPAYGRGAIGIYLHLAGTLALYAALAIIPVSIAFAIVRSHLWDIDVVIRRTLSYSALTGLLALVYFGSVVVLESIVRPLTGQSQSTFVTVASTLMIAALFVPLRARVQAAIDRRFYRSRYDAARMLAGFAQSARDETDLERLSGHLLAAVDEAMKPAVVGLWLKPAGDRRLGDKR
jgi:hypothetical protein